MAETAHTPGPWFYRPHQYTDWGEVYAGQFRICQARDPLAMGHDILKLHRQAGTDPWEANARLIAAAPDLLEACQAMIAWDDAEKQGPDYGTQTRDTHPDGELIWKRWWEEQQRLCERAFDTARAAIARATGEKESGQ